MDVFTTKRGVWCLDYRSTRCGRNDDCYEEMIEAVVEKTKKNKNRTQYHSFFQSEETDAQAASILELLIPDFEFAHLSRVNSSPIGTAVGFASTRSSQECQSLLVQYRIGKILAFWQAIS